MEVTSSTSEEEYLPQDDGAEYDRWLKLMGGEDSNDGTAIDFGIFGDDNISVIP
jgi:hypothetical protein